MTTDQLRQLIKFRMNLTRTTQAALAEATGTDKSHLSKYLNGTLALTTERAAQLLEALGASVEIRVRFPDVEARIEALTDKQCEQLYARLVTLRGGPKPSLRAKAKPFDADEVRATLLAQHPHTQVDWLGRIGASAR